MKSPKKRRWIGPLAYEALSTGDGRRFAAGALDLAGLPQPLMLAPTMEGQHKGAYEVGSITAAWRGMPVTEADIAAGFITDTGSGGLDGTVRERTYKLPARMSAGAVPVFGRGVFSDDEAGQAAADECARHAEMGTHYGVSVDLDGVSMELRAKDAATVAKMMEFEDLSDPGVLAAATNDDGSVTLDRHSSSDVQTYYTGSTVRGATMVSLPAFSGAYVELDLTEVDEDESDDPQAVSTAVDGETGGDDALTDEERDNGSWDAALEHLVAAADGEWQGLTAQPAPASLVASAYPVDPPLAFMANPQFTGPQAIRITDEGRIYGHAALWGSWHIGFAGQQIQAPRSAAGYRHFRTGLIRCDEGSEVAIGGITLGTGHAGPRMHPHEVLAHYDNTGTRVADIVVGEDEFGIWVSGALRPNLSAETVRELRAAPLSGDWREINGNLELVALLAVNTPGFGVDRTDEELQEIIAEGQRELVASAAPFAAAMSFASVLVTGNHVRCLTASLGHRVEQQPEVAPTAEPVVTTSNGVTISSGGTAALPAFTITGQNPEGALSAEEVVAVREMLAARAAAEGPMEQAALAAEQRAERLAAIRRRERVAAAKAAAGRWVGP